MNTGARIPITRNNKFFSEEDFNLQVEMGREAIESFGNFTVILYPVDKNLSDIDSLYGESDNNSLRFKTPVELKVIPLLEEAQNKAYNESKGSVRYLSDGNLTFGIYQAQLEELDTDINYGDYIGYPINETQMRYFTVVNENSKFYDNKHTIMGYRGAFRTITCVTVDSAEFDAR